MFLIEPARTPYDLRWWMLGIHVRVHPMFWLLTVVMGWNTSQLGFQYLLLWVVCVFVSILVHELGHVLMGRIFGSDGHIVLYQFGGLAIGSNQLGRRGQRIAVSFAGPLAGFLFVGVLIGVLLLVNWNWGQLAIQLTEFVVGVREFIDRELFTSLPGMGRETLLYLVQVNLVWGLLNLLPIWPLDGGQISRELLEGIRPDNGVRLALGISCACAGILAVNSLAAANDLRLIPFLPTGGLFFALLFGMLAYQSYELMQKAPVQRETWEDERWR